MGIGLDTANQLIQRTQSRTELADAVNRLNEALYVIDTTGAQAASELASEYVAELDARRATLLQAKLEELSGPSIDKEKGR